MPLRARISQAQARRRSSEGEAGRPAGSGSCDGGGGGGGSSVDNCMPLSQVCVKAAQSPEAVAVFRSHYLQQCLDGFHCDVHASREQGRPALSAFVKTRQRCVCGMLQVPLSVWASVQKGSSGVKRRRSAPGGGAAQGEQSVSPAAGRLPPTQQVPKPSPLQQRTPQQPQLLAQVQQQPAPGTIACGLVVPAADDIEDQPLLKRRSLPQHATGDRVTGGCVATSATTAAVEDVPLLARLPRRRSSGKTSPPQQRQQQLVGTQAVGRSDIGMQQRQGHTPAPWGGGPTQLLPGAANAIAETQPLWSAQPPVPATQAQLPATQAQLQQHAPWQQQQPQLQRMPPPTQGQLGHDAPMQPMAWHQRLPQQMMPTQHQQPAGHLATQLQGPGPTQQQQRWLAALPPASVPPAAGAWPARAPAPAASALGVFANGAGTATAAAPAPLVTASGVFADDEEDDEDEAALAGWVSPPALQRRPQPAAIAPTQHVQMPTQRVPPPTQVQLPGPTLCVSGWQQQQQQPAGGSAGMHAAGHRPAAAALAQPPQQQAPAATQFVTQVATQLPATLRTGTQAAAAAAAAAAGSSLIATQRTQQSHGAAEAATPVASPVGASARAAASAQMPPPARPLPCTPAAQRQLRGSTASPDDDLPSPGGTFALVDSCWHLRSWVCQTHKHFQDPAPTYLLLVLQYT